MQISDVRDNKPSFTGKPIEPIFMCVIVRVVIPVDKALLRCALNAFGMRMHFVVFIVKCSHATRPSLLSRVDVLEDIVLNHCVWRRVLSLNARREYSFEGFDVFRCHTTAVWSAQTLWEANAELNVEVAKIVMTIGRHTLSAYDLDRFYLC